MLLKPEWKSLANLLQQSSKVLIGHLVYTLMLTGLNLMARSLPAKQSTWQRWFFALIALVVSAVLVVWLKRLQAHEHWLALGLALVLGGALGNLFDRVVYGHVIDFILVHYRDWETDRKSVV